jgi:OHCU decarboxylase
MSLSLAEFDDMPAERAAPLLASCCGAGAWVKGMLERRPFGDVESLLGAADEVWQAVGPSDWLEAFAHHPRIGEREAAVAQEARAHAWSTAEQAEARAAKATVHRLLRLNNALYERRFGHIYIVSASGRSADELLAILQARLSNDAETELRVAADEQAKITRLRLLKLLGSPEPSS